MTDIPILFLVFNRPDTTKQVFEAIKRARPLQLFIAADGPRPKKDGEKEKCEEVKRIVSEIDWPCHVNTLFRKENLGCRLAVSSSINWFFENVESGIILEDDCLPNEDFFVFCSDLLEKYKNNEEVMHISATNLLSRSHGEGSYYASKYPHIWGWATWRRSWEKYSLDLNDSETLCRLIKETFTNFNEREFWFKVLNYLQDAKIDTWDYQWMFTIWKYKGICLNSNINLIENIGFGEDATHTRGVNPYHSKREALNQINHPKSLEVDQTADREFAKTVHFIEFQSSVEFYIKKVLSRLRSLIQ